MKADEGCAALIEALECTLEFAELIGEPTVAYLIERALDEAHSKHLTVPATAGRRH